MRIRQIVNRRLMSASSGSTSASAETTTGSRAIPQIGHEPGRSLTTSGCMGQVYLAPGPALRVTGGRGLLRRAAGIRGEIALRILAELLQAVMAAEVVSPSVVVSRSGCSTGVDRHAADGIFDGVENREPRMFRRRVRMVIGIHGRRDLAADARAGGGLIQLSEASTPGPWDGT